MAFVNQIIVFDIFFPPEKKTYPRLNLNKILIGWDRVLISNFNTSILTKKNYIVHPDNKQAQSTKFFVLIRNNLLFFGLANTRRTGQ